MHLEAVTFGDINRLLINVPPGFMKSLLVNVFWPAWDQPTASRRSCCSLPGASTSRSTASSKPDRAREDCQVLPRIDVEPPQR
jgi:hypothetical protein